MTDQAETLRAIMRARQQEHTGKVVMLPESRPRIMPRTLAITSGKGGVGKTNVVANLALALARHGQRIIILDADISLANLHLLFNLEPKFNLHHVLTGSKQLSEVVVSGPGGIRIIPAASGLEVLAALDDAGLDRVLTQFAQLQDVDLLLIDTAAGLDEAVMAFVLAADEVLVVTTPEAPAYMDAYHIIKAIHTRDACKPIGLVTNMCHTTQEGCETGEMLRMLANQFLGHPVKVWGQIPRDPEVPKAVRQRLPLLLTAPGAPAAQSIQRLAGYVLNLNVGPMHRSSVGDLLGRVKGWLQSSKLAGAREYAKIKVRDQGVA